MPEPFLAYISNGQLRVESEGECQILESPFGRSLRDRAIQIYNRHAWKQQGRGGQSLSRALRAPAESDPAEFRIDITSVTRGAAPGELLYTLETDEISGVFARSAEGAERRLFHTADFRLCHLDAHPDGSEVAVSLRHGDGTANLAVLKMDGSELTELTDGESIDLAPRWVPGQRRRLVFQSAGVGRDPRGRHAGQSSIAIQLLDIETGEISYLAQDEKFDFLWPRVMADGNLYYIRKPSESLPPSVDPWAALKNTLMLPFRILWVIGLVLYFFVERRTGQPLLRPKNGGGERPAKASSSWLLMRQAPGAGNPPETLAEGALSFDFAEDGSIIYSDGVDVFRLPANGGAATRIVTGANVELIAAI